MPKNDESIVSKYFNLPNPGLRSYFDMVERGQPEIYRTTFAKGEDVSDVLRQWKPTLDKLIDKWPTLVEYENSLAEKVGPMSVMKPLSERMEDIDHYYQDILLPGTYVKERAINAVLAEWSRARGVTPRSEKGTVEKMKKSTNSGSPFFQKRRLVTNKTVPSYVAASLEQVDMELPSGSWQACAVLGWRGQEGGPKPEDVKQRVVWMFPYAVNIQELQVYQPLIEAAQHFELVPAWVSMEAVDRRITKMFDTKGRDDLVICTDFSRFDQHFNPGMQLAAEQILFGILDRSDRSRFWLNAVFPIKYMIPLMYNFGQVRQGNHGMGSGSGGTNVDETLVHRALQFEVAQSHNRRLNPNSQCLGDDGIITYPGCTVEDVVQAYTDHGLEMNTDKQYASKHDCEYLRRWHHTDYREEGVCVGVYATYRALGRLCEQERFYDPEVWGPKMVALRQLSIIENCNHHPLRDEFAKFCMKRDKYRLGIDIPGFLDNIGSEAQKAMDLMPDFLGYTKSMQESADVGIDNWWIVKYLKST